jgi:hypothetical protein
MTFTKLLLPWEAAGWGLVAAPVDTGGMDGGAAGSTKGPGIAAPHFEQNLPPGATGDPQFPQNPATYHLEKGAVLP